LRDSNSNLLSIEIRLLRLMIQWSLCLLPESTMDLTRNIAT
jgi:hypothetical protein